MQRIDDTLLTKINDYVNLIDKNIIEIGCGNGSKSINLAKLCAKLTAIDPDSKAIKHARTNFSAENITYKIGRAESIDFSDSLFDVVIFSLSLHHVPIHKMHKSLEEAVRICKSNGFIIFIEPEFIGTFFQAELLFDGCDGDERKQKAAAYLEILSNNLMQEIEEFYDSVLFSFENEADFMEIMQPKQNVHKIKSFLTRYNYKLEAQRRVNIYKPVKR